MEESDPAAPVRALLDAFRRHDLDGMLEHLHVNAYFVPSGYRVAPSQGDFSGHAGVREWWDRENAQHLDVWPSWIEVLDETHVFVELQIGAVSPTERIWERVTYGCIYTVRNRKVCAVEIFEDRSKAYERAHRRLAPF